MENKNSEKFVGEENFIFFLVLLVFVSIIVTACSSPETPAPLPCGNFISIESNNPHSTFARVGDTVTISGQRHENIDKISAKIGGKDALITKEITEVVCEGSQVIKWTAARTMQENDQEGLVVFEVAFSASIESPPSSDPKDIIGNVGPEEIPDPAFDFLTITETSVTDGSSVLFDKTPPTISGEVIEESSTGADGEEWYFSNVTVRFYIDEALSGISDFSSDSGQQIINTTDIVFTPEGENQSVVGSVVDGAGNQASFTVDGINIKKLIVVAVMDGAKGNGKIFTTFEDAMVREGLDLSSSYAKIDSSFEGDEIRNAMTTINVLANAMEATHRANRSDIRLLLVGKSLGGAKFYSMLFFHAQDLAKFYKVGVVFVDPHSLEGDEGDCGEWNGFIFFSDRQDDNGDCYDLDWFGDIPTPPTSDIDELFNSKDEQEDMDSKLRIFNIYQRDDLIKGYSFTEAYLNLNVLDWGGYSYDGDEYRNREVFNLEEYRWQAVTHFNIDNCRETRNLIREAIRYVLEK